MILGITGGIGSGKSTVCKIFNILGIPVFLSDIEASVIMNTDPQVMENINSLAGADLYQTGKLDRLKLANIIFNNKSILQKVNELVHPLVYHNLKIWTEKQKSEYVIMESAIIIESGASKHVDKILTVIAPVEERIERVVRRDKLSVNQILERIENQTTDEIRLSSSDYIIYNSGSEMIIPAIIKIHNDILKGITKDNL